MKITYIKHSGFCIEWKECVWIFDYWMGKLPEFSQEKSIYVFASHHHPDHFNPKIFEKLAAYPKVQYIFSDDIKDSVETLPMEAAYMKPYDVLEKDGMVIETLNSTDCGVAFIIQYDGKSIYHAGDLNWWLWDEDGEEERENMTRQFKEEIQKLKDKQLSFDVAFIPLDPRLGETNYRLGMDCFLEQIKVKKVYPMHFWNSYEWITKYKETLSEELREKIVEY